MRGKPEPRKGKGMLSWRSRQKPGAIMKPSIFQEIMEGEMERGLGKERATKAAGATYWRAARKKYKEAKKK